MKANEILNEASIVKKLKGASKRRRKSKLAPTTSKIRNPQTGRYTTAQGLAGHNAFSQMASQLAPQDDEVDTSPGASAFGQMASQLTKPATKTTSSTGGTIDKTATGIKHTASKTNPNIQPKQAPQPIAKPAKTYQAPSSPQISKAEQNEMLSRAITSINKLGNLHTLRKIKQVLDAKMAQFE